MLDSGVFRPDIAVPEKMISAPLLVLGIGNRLLSDDGIGPFVVERLKNNQASEGKVDYLDGGTLSFTLMNRIEDLGALIVIDACELHSEPGTVRVLEGAAMDLHMRSGKRSVHEVALSDLLDMARLRGCLPERRALVGVQPECLGWGLELTKTAETAVETVCGHVGALIKRWQS